MNASIRYLNQRYSMPYDKVKGLLTDIGTEELAHVEIISAILYQLTKNLTIDQIKESGFDKYFVDHTTGIYPIAASGTPFTAAFFQSTGDVISDLVENLAAEQKARTTYDNILRITDDPDVKDVIRFLRQRELVHFQRFGDSILTNLSAFLLQKLYYHFLLIIRQKMHMPSFFQQICGTVIQYFFCSWYYLVCRK